MVDDCKAEFPNCGAPFNNICECCVELRKAEADVKTFKKGYRQMVSWLLRCPECYQAKLDYRCLTDKFVCENCSAEFEEKHFIEEEAE